jgi:hypothetical protein
MGECTAVVITPDSVDNASQLIWGAPFGISTTICFKQGHKINYHYYRRRRHHHHHCCYYCYCCYYYYYYYYYY